MQRSIETTRVPRFEFHEKVHEPRMLFQNRARRSSRTLTSWSVAKLLCARETVQWTTGFASRAGRNWDQLRAQTVLLGGLEDAQWEATLRVRRRGGIVARLAGTMGRCSGAGRRELWSCSQCDGHVAGLREDGGEEEEPLFIRMHGSRALLTFSTGTRTQEAPQASCRA